MKLRPLAALWLVGALATGAARAETLTIEDATRLAQERSPRRQEAQALVEGARAAVSVARSGYLPDANLAAVATAGFGGSTQQLGVRGIINSPYTQHFGAGIEAGWTVYDFGRTSSRVDAALARVDSATAWKGLTGRAAALDAARAFGAALMAEEDARATAAAVGFRSRGADASRTLARTGLRPEMDALLAGARAAEAKAALAIAEAEVGVARATLGAMLGRPLSAATTLSAPEPRKSDVDHATVSAGAAPRDPLHDVAAAEEARAAALDRAATAEHLPRLVVAGSAGYARRVAPDEPGYVAAGAGVVVPLFAFVGEAARAREAGASARGAAARASGRRRARDSPRPRDRVAPRVHGGARGRGHVDGRRQDGARRRGGALRGGADLVRRGRRGA